MFLGTHTPKLDEKGRLVLPVKFRSALAEGLVITRWQDRSLAIWPMAAFVEQTSALRAASATNKQIRDYQRMLAAGASDETMDKQGRITIPPHLRAYAGLDKDCVVAGAMNRVEIWNQSAWEAYTARQEPEFADMNDDMFPGL